MFNVERWKEIFQSIQKNKLRTVTLKHDKQPRFSQNLRECHDFWDSVSGLS